MPHLIAHHLQRQLGLCSGILLPHLIAHLLVVLNSRSVSDAQRTIVKTGSLSIKTNDVRKAGESVKQIISDTGSFMSTMSKRDDDTKYAKSTKRSHRRLLLAV